MRLRQNKKGDTFNTSGEGGWTAGAGAGERGGYRGKGGGRGKGRGQGGRGPGERANGVRGRGRGQERRGEGRLGGWEQVGVGLEWGQEKQEKLGGLGAGRSKMCCACPRVF